MARRRRGHRLHHRRRARRQLPALPPAEDAGGDRHHRLGGARAGLARAGRTRRARRRRLRELLHRRQHLPARRRRGGAADAGAAAVRRLDPRGASRRPSATRRRARRCMLRDTMGGAGFDRAIDMSSTQGRHDSRHSYHRIRCGLGYDRAFTHRARSPRALPAARSWPRSGFAAGRGGSPWPTSCRRRLESFVGAGLQTCLETCTRETVMRTPFTGVGTALITPFTKGGAIDEAAVKRLAKRQIDAGVHFLVPVRHDRRITHAHPPREAAGGGARRRGGRRQGAGDGRRRRLRHARGDRTVARHGEGGRRRPAARVALLQQADAGRAVPALQGDCREHPPADRAVQHPGAHRREHRRGHGAPAGADPQHRRHQGSVGQPRPDDRHRGQRARGASCC